MMTLKQAALALTLLAAALTHTAQAEPVTGKPAASRARCVLVMGVDDNVRSNFFDNHFLSADAGFSADSVSAVYNRVIAENLGQMAEKEKLPLRFVQLSAADADWRTLAKSVRLTGDDTQATADLTAVDAQKLQQLMDEAGAGYLLVLDSHYMKYQDQPFRTLFHFVNYSLYDAQKNRITQGSNYFTSINPQSATEMRKSSRKSASKMVEAIASTID